MLRIITWNLFHGQDGTGLGPTFGSTVFRRPVDDGVNVHLNRKWVDEMAAVITSINPTVAALQEVPPRSVARLAQLTGRRAESSLMRPALGPVGLRCRLAERNPDLWRTHEGTANVLLVPNDWHCVERWTLRHNPPLVALRHGHRLRLSLRDRLHWLLEPRRLIGARFRLPDGRRIVAVSLHCHDAAQPEVIVVEVQRILADLERRVSPGEPIVVAGDFNCRGRTHPALQAMLTAGYVQPTLDNLGIDHIFHRGLQVIDPPAICDVAVRNVTISTPAGERRVVLSDHDIVAARYRVE